MYIIAEIGTNHDGSPEYALDLVQAALECGVDAVKMQLFRADQLVAKDAPPLPHAKTHETQYERMRHLELPFWVYESASYLVHQKVKHFIVSAFDPESLLSVAPLCDKIKIASGDLTYTPILDAAKDSGKPIILSTGMADFHEIDESVCRCHPETIMHCTSIYPCPPDKAEVGAVRALQMEKITRESWGHVKHIGYSDHCIGMNACIAAAALGAKVIEKHFTINHDSSHGDHPHSADPFEMEFIADACRDVEKMVCPTIGRSDKESRKYLRRASNGLRGHYVCE